MVFSAIYAAFSLSRHLCAGDPRNLICTGFDPTHSFVQKTGFKPTRSFRPQMRSAFSPSPELDKKSGFSSSKTFWACPTRTLPAFWLVPELLMPELCCSVRLSSVRFCPAKTFWLVPEPACSGRLCVFHFLAAFCCSHNNFDAVCNSIASLPAVLQSILPSISACAITAIVTWIALKSIKISATPKPWVPRSWVPHPSRSLRRVG